MLISIGVTSEGRTTVYDAEGRCLSKLLLMAVLCLSVRRNVYSE